MSFLKAEVSFSSNFTSFFSAIKHNSYVHFQLKTLYTLIKKSSLTCKFLRLSSARAKLCQIPHINFETKSQFLSKFYIILHYHNFVISFRLIHFVLWILSKCPVKVPKSNVIYFAQKKPIKVQFWRLLRARVKIHQILVTFETTNQFFFEFCITLQYHET